MEKLSCKHTFGPFAGDDGKKKKVASFLERSGVLSVEDVLSALRDLPYSLRISVFSNWIRKNRESDFCQQTLDNLFAASQIEREGGEEEGKVEDPLLKVFAPQQTLSSHVYDVLQLFLFGSSALQSKENLMKLVTSPSTRFQDAAISELFKSNLLSDEEVLQLLSEVKEHTLRTIVRCCVRHHRTSLLLDMFPSKVASTLGNRAMLSLIHTLPSELVKKYIGGFLYDPSEPHSLEVSECQLIWKSCQSQLPKSFWTDIWRFHSSTMVDTLFSQLKNARNFGVFQKIWNRWETPLVTFFNNVLKGNFSIRVESDKGTLKHLFSQLFRMYFVEFPPYSISSSKARESINAGGLSLASALRSGEASIHFGYSMTSPLYKLVDTTTVGEFLFRIFSERSDLDSGSYRFSVDDYLLKAYSLTDLLAKLAPTCKDRKNERETKELFAKKIFSCVAPHIPSSDIYQSCVTNSYVHSIVNYFLSSLIPRFSFSTLESCYPILKTLMESSRPTASTLGFFPSQIPQHLFSTVIPNSKRKGFLKNWINYCKKIQNSILGCFTHAFTSLKRSMAESDVERRFERFESAFTLWFSDVEDFLSVVDVLTCKDKIVEDRNIKELLEGKKEWIAVGKGYLRLIKERLETSLSIRRKSALTERIEKLFFETSKAKLLPRVKAYVREMSTSDLYYYSASKQIKSIFRTLGFINSGPHSNATFRTVIEIAEDIRTWVESYSDSTEWDSLRPHNFFFRGALGTLDAREPTEECQELVARYTNFTLWLNLLLERANIRNEERTVPVEKRELRIAGLKMSQFKKVLGDLTRTGRKAFVTEEVQADALRYITWDAKLVLHPWSYQIYRSTPLGPQLFQALPKRTLAALTEDIIPIYFKLLRKSIEDAVLGSKANLEVVQIQAARNFLTNLPKSISLPLLKALSSCEGRKLIDIDGIRQLVVQFKFSISDEWVYEQVKGATDTSIILQKQDAMTHLFETAWETGKCDVFTESFAFIIDKCKDDSPNTRLKFLASLNEKLVQKLKKDFNRSSTIFQCDTVDGDYPHTAMWLELVGSILASPETENKKQLLVRVESFAAVLLKNAIKSFARCSSKLVEAGKEMGDYSPAQKALFNLAAEIKWRTRNFLVGEKKAIETFEIALGRIYKEMEGSKEVKIHATTKTLELVLGQYSHYVGKFWEDVSRLSSSFFVRVKSLFDICWGHPERHPVYTQIAMTFLELAKENTIPRAVVVEVNQFMIDTAHCGLPKWRRNDQVVRDYVQVMLFQDNDQPKDSLFGLWLKMQLPITKGSKGKALKGGGKIQPPTRKQKKEYHVTRVDLVSRLLGASDSAIHIKLVWAFLVRHRQDLLAPLLEKSKLSSFPGPFVEFCSRSAIVRSDYSDEDTAATAIRGSLEEEGDEGPTSYLLPATFGLHRISPLALKPVSDLLTSLFLSPNHPVPVRARYAHLFAHLPNISFSDLLPIMKTVDSQGEKDSLPSAVLNELITVSLASDEPKAPYLFLFSEEVLRKTDDRVMLQVVNAATQAVDASKNATQLATMVQGLLRPKFRREAMSPVLHRIILRLLKFDPCQIAFEHLSWELKEPSSPSIKAAVLRIIQEFLSSDSEEDLSSLWEALDCLVSKPLEKILPEEAAGLFAVIPKPDHIIAHCLAHQQRDARSVLASDARLLAPLISKAGNVAFPPEKARRFFENVLMKLYSKPMETTVPAEVTRAWEKSLANPALFTQWKESFVLLFGTWSLLPELHETIAKELLSFVLLCLPNPPKCPPPIGKELIEGLRSERKDSSIKLFSSVLMRIPFLDAEHADDKAKPIYELYDHLTKITQTAPFSDARSLTFVLRLFSWSMSQFKLDTFSETTKWRTKKVLLAMGAHFRPLVTIISDLKSLFSTMGSTVGTHLTHFESELRTARHLEKPSQVRSSSSSSSSSNSSASQWGASSSSRWDSPPPSRGFGRSAFGRGGGSSRGRSSSRGGSRSRGRRR